MIELEPQIIIINDYLRSREKRESNLTEWCLIEPLGQLILQAKCENNTRNEVEQIVKSWLVINNR